MAEMAFADEKPVSLAAESPFRLKQHQEPDPYLDQVPFPVRRPMPGSRTEVGNDQNHKLNVSQPSGP